MTPIYRKYCLFHAELRNSKFCNKTKLPKSRFANQTMHSILTAFPLPCTQNDPKKFAKFHLWKNVIMWSNKKGFLFSFYNSVKSREHFRNLAAPLARYINIKKLPMCLFVHFMWLILRLVIRFLFLRLPVNTYSTDDQARYSEIFKLALLSLCILYTVQEIKKEKHKFCFYFSSIIKPWMGKYRFFYFIH